MAPKPRPKADPRAMRAEDVERIRQLLAAGWSQRAIEVEMFGYTGGAAWEAVRQVLGEDTNRSAACDPTPGYQFSKRETPEHYGALPVAVADNSALQ